MQTDILQDMQNPVDNELRLCLISDHPIFVAGVKSLLQGTVFKIVCEFDSIHGAREKVFDAKAKIVLLDTEIDVLLNHVFAIRQFATESKLLLMSPEKRQDSQLAVELGAHALLSKGSTESQLRTTLQLLASHDWQSPQALPLQVGKLWRTSVLNVADATLLISPDVLESDGKEHSESTNKYSRLSPKRLKILKYIARGLTTSEIANLMGVKKSTVADHIRRLYEHTGCTNRIALIRWLFNLDDFPFGTQPTNFREENLLKP